MMLFLFFEFAHQKGFKSGITSERILFSEVVNGDKTATTALAPFVITYLESVDQDSSNSGKESANCNSYSMGASLEEEGKDGESKKESKRIKKLTLGLHLVTPIPPDW